MNYLGDQLLAALIRSDNEKTAASGAVDPIADELVNSPSSLGELEWRDSWGSASLHTPALSSPTGSVLRLTPELWDTTEYPTAISFEFPTQFYPETASTVLGVPSTTTHDGNHCPSTMPTQHNAACVWLIPQQAVTETV
jgi:hypothetical protein